MASTANTPDPRDTRIGRLAASVYRYVVAEVGFLLAAAPGLLALVFVAPVSSNIPLLALCAVPVGPAFAATLYALRPALRADERGTWRLFWHGWRINVVDVLWSWVPALAIATAIAIGIVFGPLAGVPWVFVVIGAVLMLLLAVWTLIAIVIASQFAFRARDRARLASYYLAARPLVSLGMASLLILAGALTFFASGWAVALTASLFAGLAGTYARPVVRDIGERFIAPDEGPSA